jgi:membrane-associated protease RseP (regulator of RpoE activity)
MLSSMNTPDSFDDSRQPPSAAPLNVPSDPPLHAIPIDDPPSHAHIGPPLRMENLVTERRPRVVLPVVLFFATCLSTFFVGALHWEPQQIFMIGGDAGILVRQMILRRAGEGTTYMVCVIAILFAHEMGHYIATRIYGVPASLPFFIPFPIAPIGTMGAVIAMKGYKANRREIFDIGLAGPLAGLVFAIPIIWWGIAKLDPSQAEVGLYRYDLPLLARWLYAFLHPGAAPLRELHANQANAMFMAGWVGLLITGLNMLPVSQLDGGHVTYTLFGKYSRWIARAFMVTAIVYMIRERTLIWVVMIFLVFLIGIHHPKTANDHIPLGWSRTILGLLSLLIPILCFPPRGLMYVGP